jgi:hypothetical protein
MIFEFKEMNRAKAFADAVQERFGLGGRVFDDADAAAASHAFPWRQEPPVVHIDRPWWGTDPKTTEWDDAWKIEPLIGKMAKEFGGVFVGT